MINTEKNTSILQNIENENNAESYPPEIQGKIMSFIPTT
jgi:hypothetical protein